MPFSSILGTIERISGPSDFSTLDVTGPGGLAVTGAGAADVVTPPAFRPGSRLSVRRRSGELTYEEQAAADDQGRLNVRVPLGSGGPARRPSPSAAGDQPKPVAPPSRTSGWALT